MKVPEIVRGMAEAVEQRRLERGLSPGQFAAAAGITPAGLAPVRKGIRKNYQDSVKIGVARALGWRADAVDRLLAGEDPVPLEELDPTEQMAETITRLDAAVRELNRRIEDLEAQRSAAEQPPPRAR